LLASLQRPSLITPPTLDEVKAELATRALLDFTLYTKPDYEVNWHHAVVCEALDRFVAGEIRRLMLFMPPQNGKSELVSRRLPAYILGRNPDAKLIACSYSADLASQMNRDVQRIIDAPEYARVFPETTLFGSNVRSSSKGSYLRNSDIFEIVGREGRYKGAGVGGPITGFGFDIGIIDDPTKNREEADSEVYRERLWEWYTSTFYSRMRKGALSSILITLTRWHEDGIEARLLKLAEENEDADQWEVISLPAIAEEPAPPDIRKEGEPLWPTRFPLAFLRAVQAQNPYDFAALYQQRPAPREGNLFKWAWFEDNFVDAVPADASFIRYWDNAGTEGGGAYTAGVLIARKGPRFYIVDVVRGQWSAQERRAQKRATAISDREKYGHVTIWGEQEPGSGGKEQADIETQYLVGFDAHAERVTGDKYTRALPLAAQCEAGNVYILRDTEKKRWNQDYLREMTSFPSGKYKDQVDGSSGGFNKLALLPAVPPPSVARSSGKITQRAGSPFAQNTKSKTSQWR
jgi:predicted phage terminase large subunit-like protein